MLSRDLPRRVLLVFLPIWFSIATAQWNWKSPMPQGNTLLKVEFIDTTSGWAVGEYGTVLRTTNGGFSWYDQEYGRTDNILALAMVSDTMGWAVGDNGTILHTTDSGDTWEEQASGVGQGLNAVTFIDAQRGWAAGDNETILQTTNGGTSWEVQHQNNSPPISINAITFFDPSNGWAVGSNRAVFHTTDGGTIWSKTIVGLASSTYLSISFVTPSLGFIVGTGGVILRTDNSGATWAPIASGVTGNLNDIRMQNTFVGWICGDAGLFLKTINGGLSWSSTIIGEGYNFNSLSRAGGKLWMVGEMGTMLRSTNSGLAWNALDRGTRLSANWIDAPSDSVICAVGQTGLIYRTTDRGQSWAEQTSPAPSASCYGTKFIDPLHGWAVGDNGLIIRTTDGGSWTAQSSPTSSTLLAIAFSSMTDGWIVGGEYTTYSGSILHSTDGGASWYVQNATIPHILYGISFASPSTGWAVGEEGLILHTTNGGTSWAAQPSGVGAALFWCAFKDDAHGWAVGDSGTILKTTNGGATWVKQRSGTSSILFSIVTRGAAEAIVVGDNGIILRTTDSGNSWAEEYGRTPVGLYSIAQSGNSSYWIAGDYGTILNELEFVPTTGAISGVVFNDMNGNGIADPGEPGLQGWTVAVAGAQSNSAFTGPGGAFIIPNLPFGTYVISLVSQPGWTQTTPSSPATYSVTLSSSNDLFSGNFGTHAPDALKYVLAGGWNLISIPEKSEDPRTSQVFPTAISYAFSFNGTYQRKDSMEHGAGFWVKFPSRETLYVAGTPVDSDTIPVRQGWNLIGSVYDTIPEASLITDPPGVIISSMYGYHGSYNHSSSVIPGEGYWLKFAQQGKLIFPSPALSGAGAAPPVSHTGEVSRFERLHIADGARGASTLYFAPGSAGTPDAVTRELPPPPPPGCFDVRFANGSDMIVVARESGRESRVPIRIQTTASALTLTWNVSPHPGIRFLLREKSPEGALLAVVADSGSIVLTRLPADGLLLEVVYGPDESAAPRAFALYQNTPNPFNPSTMIQFDLPSRSHVRLGIYDILGRSVANLVDETLDAGVHRVAWTPAVSSGLYLYRVEATEFDGGHRQFTQVRKMIFLK